MNDKTIIRAARSAESPYFASARKVAQDKNLSYEARGLLWYLLSKPDDWQVMIVDLVIEKCKRFKVYRILKELIDAGYIAREQMRDAKGKWSTGEYRVYETPCVNFPHTDEPNADEPHAEDQPLQNIDSTDQRNQQNKDWTDKTTPNGAELGSEASKSKKKVEKPKDPDGGAIAALIDAWLKASGTINPKAFAVKSYRDLAREMHKRGVLPLHITEYIQTLRHDPWWATREIKFAKVAAEITAYLQKTRGWPLPEAKPAEPTGEPELPTPTAPATHPQIDPALLKKLQAEMENA